MRKVTVMSGAKTFEGVDAFHVRAYFKHALNDAVCAVSRSVGCLPTLVLVGTLHASDSYSRTMLHAGALGESRIAHPAVPRPVPARHAHAVAHTAHSHAHDRVVDGHTHTWNRIR